MLCLEALVQGRFAWRRQKAKRQVRSPELLCEASHNVKCFKIKSSNEKVRFSFGCIGCLLSQVLVHAHMSQTPKENAF